MPKDSGTKFEGEALLRLKSLLPEFNAYIEAENPSLQSYHKGTSAWKKNKAKLLMAEEVFKKLLDEGKSKSLEYKDWEQAIIRFFTNHYNNRYLPKTGANRSSGKPSENNPTITLPSNDSLKSLFRNAVCFFGDLPARALFAEDERTQAALLEKIGELKSQYPNLNSGALRNKALKCLWEAADQDYWNERVEKVKGDVESNREHFPLIIHNTLQDLATRECLGSIALSFSYAYRDLNTNGIKGGTVYSGYDADKKCLIDVKPGDKCSDISYNEWVKCVDAILPRPASEKPSTDLSVNEDGLPILPRSLDIGQCNPTQLAALLNEYFMALWDYSGFALSGTMQIPWELISVRPSAYYDTALFQLPVPLSNPISLKGQPAALFSLTEYLLSHSPPFRLYTFAQHSQLSIPATPRHDNTSPGTECASDLSSQKIAPNLSATKDAANSESASPALSQHTPHSQTAAVEDMTPPLLRDADPSQQVTKVPTTENMSVSTSQPPQTLLDTTSPEVITVQKGRKRSRKLSVGNPATPRELRRREKPATAAPVPEPPKKRRKSKRTLWHYEDLEGNLVDKHGNRIDEEGNRIFPEH